MQAKCCRSLLEEACEHTKKIVELGERITASESKRRELVELLTDVKYALEERDCDRIVAKINAALADDAQGGG